MRHKKNVKISHSLQLALLTAALGYFVDVYDIILFSAVRIPSLESLGYSGAELTQTGFMLLNLQLIGMVVGGFLWGILGDRKGRVSVLFGSIFLYSTANLLNAAATNVTMYGIFRFLAGLGLAGELGAGVTLVSELMPREKRGYGTMLIAFSGVLGGITGGLVGDQVPWQWAYVIGGLLGFGLLFLRWSVSESPLFSSLKKQPVSRGNLLALIRSPEHLVRYIKCLCVGAPIWIFIGIFMTLSPEIARELDLPSPVSAGKAILFFNVGFGLGEVGSSILSQYWQSRRKAVGFFLILNVATILTFLSLLNADTTVFYCACSFIGFGAGYWAVFLMISAEQFGTNFRATVTTSIPNLVRGLIVPLFILMQMMIPQLGILNSLKVLALSSLLLAGLCLYRLRETQSVDLDFVDPI